MVLNVHRNHKAYEGAGTKGEWAMEVGEEGDISIDTFNPFIPTVPYSGRVTGFVR